MDKINARIVVFEIFTIFNLLLISLHNNSKIHRYHHHHHVLFESTNSLFSVLESAFGVVFSHCTSFGLKEITLVRLANRGKLSKHSCAVNTPEENENCVRYERNRGDAVNVYSMPHNV